MAALNTKTGEILWRKVFEKNDRGDIKLLHVQSDPNKINRPNADDGIITVSGSNPALVRGWDAKTGNIEWEWSLTPTSVTNLEHTIWFYDNLYIYHVVPVYGAHIELTAYYASTGQQVKQTSTKIAAAWINKNACVLAAPYFTCVVKNQIISIDLTSDANELLTKALDRDYSGQTPTLLRVNIILLVVCVINIFFLYREQMQQLLLARIFIV